jgi:hypothetical protein
MHVVVLCGVNASLVSWQPQQFVSVLNLML